MPILLTPRVVAELSLVGMGFDVLGGCYLAYDLLGGRGGPLRVIARAAGYVALFFVGYAVVLGLKYAVVAASGMGLLLAFDYRLAAGRSADSRARQAHALAFGFLRGMVLGVAGITIAGLAFGTVFGLLSGIGLSVVNLLGFAPTDDYEAKSRPRTSGHKLLASLWRAVAVGVAGVAAGISSASQAHSVLFGLQLGVAAGTVSALVGLFSPAIEWWIENLPERRLGALGLGLILIGVLFQSLQYWIVVLEVPVH